MNHEFYQFVVGDPDSGQEQRNKWLSRNCHLIQRCLWGLSRLSMSKKNLSPLKVKGYILLWSKMWAIALFGLLARLVGLARSTPYCFWVKISRFFFPRSSHVIVSLLCNQRSSGSLAFFKAFCGVTPQAQNTGTSPSSVWNLEIYQELQVAVAVLWKCLSSKVWLPSFILCAWSMNGQLCLENRLRLREEPEILLSFQPKGILPDKSLAL